MNFGDILKKLGSGIINGLFPSQTTNLYGNNPPPEVAGAQVQPVASQMPAPQTFDDVQKQAGFRLSVPDENGGTFDFPPDIAQAIGNVFEPSKTATEAARVLRHPMAQTRTPAEIGRLGQNFNRGENPDLKVNNIDVQNPNGSWDRGLFRVNDQTFNGMMESPAWRSKMEARGIDSWDDMEDLNKNVEMAKLILSRGNWDSQFQTMKNDPSWMQWYAAPLDLRQR